MIRKLITLAISLLILGAIYYQIDVARLAAVFANADPNFMTVSLGMVVPLTLLTAWRLQLLAPRGANIGFVEANRLVLAASALNMILPSKMGDIAKAYFMKSETARGALTFSLVIFEKTADMLSLLFWCALGLLLYPRKDTIFWTLAGIVILGLAAGTSLLTSRRLAGLIFASGALQSGWNEMQDFFWSNKERVARVLTLSLFIWFLHLLQIWLFIFALRASAPFIAGLALAPLAILAGLLPFTFAGIGTRDAALIVLYRPYFDAPVAAALGILCTARYVIPAIAGVPFLQRYLGKSAA